MTATPQNISVDELGRVTSSYKDNNPVTVKDLGRQSIARFSEVLHDETEDAFYIVFRERAPSKYVNNPLGCETFSRYTGEEVVWIAMVPTDNGLVETPCFPSYEMAVSVEMKIQHEFMLGGLI